MKKQDLTEIIINTLELVYEQGFEEVNVPSMRRYYNFTSDNYSFSFPANIAGLLSKEELKTKVNNWLKHNSVAITKDNQYSFDELGNIQ